MRFAIKRELDQRLGLLMATVPSRGRTWQASITSSRSPGGFAGIFGASIMPPMSNRISELAPSARLLLGPGPSMVHPRVLRAMSTPLIGHLDPEFLTI